ncbi:unnamed protein product [Nippostrongylus brasiliensis]|uniref:Cytoplasmic polyadenylation element-binding protein 1 n=1 Tax=Nippostrongylus brasiliensis TaxID=27835 RepID=A0A158R1C2_NIPBR|nr:unnamed protein product [Nippostrongylus brasiliensis]
MEGLSASLSVQIPPYSSESPATPDRVLSRSSILDDNIATQVRTYNPMFGAEKLFAGLVRPPAVSQSNFAYSCHSHSATGITANRYGRAEDAIPLLLAGTRNVFFKPPTTSAAPPVSSTAASLCSNESISSASTPPSSSGKFHGQVFACDKTMIRKLPAPASTPAEAKSPQSPRKIIGAPSKTPSQPNEVEVFARKVFVGGLPIDVTEEEIWQTFSVFGNVLVDWPRRPDGTSARDEESGRGSRSMTGYVFLVFEEESSVQYLVSECHKEDDRYYLFVSSPTMRDKPVQVRPWRLADMDFISNPRTVMDPRRTVFIGGVPRPTRANELAECLERLYGPVCYVGIDIDPELKYPKGAARVTFVTTQAFIAAINGRFVHVHHGDSQKRVEIKPYVMDEQMCDHCEGKQCSSRYAPYFCGDVDCLQYYCEICWDRVHYRPGSRRMEHRPLVRMGDQTKVSNVGWN